MHALRQARRVLKCDGYLLDMRPAPVHRRVAIENEGSYEHVGVMGEVFDDDYAANDAVKSMVDAGLVKVVSSTRFECTRRMDRFSEFQRWIEEPARLRKLRAPKRLLEKVKKALHSRSGIMKSNTGRTRIVVRGPIDLRVLAKR